MDLDALVGGVLCTRSAWVIGFVFLVARVRAGAEVWHFPSACQFDICEIHESQLDICEMTGRPETHPIKKVIGFSEGMIDAVESWRAKQKPVPNLSEAIRRLVEIGLKKK